MEEPFFVEINLPTAYGRISESAVSVLWLFIVAHLAVFPHSG
jgi:hypothetical protein